MGAQEIRAALDRHWTASMPTILKLSTTSISRMRCWNTLSRRANPRSAQHTDHAHQSAEQKRFAVRRVIGSGDLWITEYILTYDGKPSYTVSIMEFSGDKVARETQYFADRSRPARARSVVERMK